MIEARTWANETATPGAAAKRQSDTRSAAERKQELEQLKQEFGK